MTVRDHVRELQAKLQAEATASDGHTMRIIHNKSAALLGNVNAELLDAEVAFNTAHAALMRELSAAKASVLAKAGPEYKRLRQAELVQDEVKAVFKASDNALRSLASEQYAMGRAS